MVRVAEKMMGEAVTTGKAVDAATAREDAVRKLRVRAERQAAKAMKPRAEDAPPLEVVARGEVEFVRDAVFDQEEAVVNGEVRVTRQYRRTGYRKVSPLDRLLSRKSLTVAQHKVGVAFRDAYSAGGYEIRAVAAGGGIGGAKDPDAKMVNRLAALARVTSAKLRLSADQFDVLVHVAHREEEAGSWPGVAKFHRNNRGGEAVKVLIAGLDVLYATGRWG
jgi:hypothetical protein